MVRWCFPPFMGSALEKTWRGFQNLQQPYLVMGHRGRSNQCRPYKEMNPRSWRFQLWPIFKFSAYPKSIFHLILPLGRFRNGFTTSVLRAKKFSINLTFQPNWNHFLILFWHSLWLFFYSRTKYYASTLEWNPPLQRENGSQGRSRVRRNRQNRKCANPLIEVYLLQSRLQLEKLSLFPRRGLR